MQFEEPTCRGKGCKQIKNLFYCHLLQSHCCFKCSDPCSVCKKQRNKPLNKFLKQITSKGINQCRKCKVKQSKQWLNFSCRHSYCLKCVCVKFYILVKQSLDKDRLNTQGFRCQCIKLSAQNVDKLFYYNGICLNQKSLKSLFFKPIKFRQKIYNIINHSRIFKNCLVNLFTIKNISPFAFLKILILQSLSSIFSSKKIENVKQSSEIQNSDTSSKTGEKIKKLLSLDLLQQKLMSFTILSEKITIIEDQRHQIKQRGNSSKITSNQTQFKINQKSNIQNNFHWIFIINFLKK